MTKVITWRELLAWTLAIAGAVGLGFLYVENIRRDLNAEREALKKAESAKLATAGAIPATAVSQEELVKLIRETLKEELAEVRKAVPKAKPTAAAKITSEPIKGVVIVPAPETLPGEECPAFPPEGIVIPAEFEVGSVVAKVEGPLGAEALIGTVELWQVDPPPRRLFGTAPFKSDASQYFKIAPPAVPAPPKWRAEIRAGIDTDLRARLGGTYYGRTRVGFWGEVGKEIDSSESLIVATGIAVRLGR